MLKILNDNLFVYSLCQKIIYMLNKVVNLCLLSLNGPSVQIGKLPCKTHHILLTLIQWSLWLFKYILTQLAIWFTMVFAAIQMQINTMVAMVI